MKKVTGTVRGTIYAYRWFKVSISMLHKCKEMDGVPLGISSITMSAFMMESYINHVCQGVFDYFRRAREYIDDVEHDYWNKKTFPDNKRSLEENIAIEQGYIKQFNTMKNMLSKGMSSRRKTEFKKEFSPNEEGTVTFADLDKRYRFPPRKKYKAILEIINGPKGSEYIEFIKELFSIRDMLAHGRTEDVSTGFSFSMDCASDIDTKKIPKPTTKWQQSCSRGSAEEYLSKCEEIVGYIHFEIFGSKTPFSPLESHIAGSHISEEES